MRKSVLFAAIAVAMLAGACRSTDNGGVNQKVSQVSLAKAPPAVVNAVHRDFPNATITRIERDRTSTTLSYIVYLTTSTGDRRELRYDAIGNRLGT